MTTTESVTVAALPAWTAAALDGSWRARSWTPKEACHRQCAVGAVRPLMSARNYAEPALNRLRERRGGQSGE
jgi:hypothetical protein